MGRRPEDRLLRKVAAFGVAPLANVLTPFVVLPILAANTTTAGWAALAVGQSIGALAAAVIAFGWPVVGPVEVARADPQQVRRIYTDSLLSRAMLSPIVLLLVAAASWAAAPGGEFMLTVTVAAASATFGFSPTWVAIGLGRAKSIVLFETVPRAALVVAAAVAIALGASIYAYPTALALSTLLALAAFSRWTVRPISPGRAWFGAVAARLRGLASAAASTLTGSLYSAGALFLVGIVATVEVTAEVSSADRLYRIGLLTVIVLTNAFQGWVVDPDPVEAARRRGVALRIHLGVGITGAVAYTAAAPVVASLLFGADLAPSYLLAAFYGATFAALAVASSLAQHFLVPAGQVRGVLTSTVLGAAVGVPAILLLSGQIGAAGAGAGLFLSEAVVLVTQAIWWRRHRRGLRSSADADLLSLTGSRARDPRARR